MSERMPGVPGQPQIDASSGAELAPGIDKLRRLEKYLPDELDVIYDYGRFLADRLNPEIVPEGFVLAASLATHDLREGVDGFTGEQIDNRLTMYPPFFYDLLFLLTSRIAHAVYPEDFAGKVDVFLQEVNKQSK